MFEEKPIKCKDCLWWFPVDEYGKGFCGIPLPMWLSSLEREEWNNADAGADASKCEAFEETED